MTFAADKGFRNCPRLDLDSFWAQGCPEKASNGRTDAALEDVVMVTMLSDKHWCSGSEKQLLSKNVAGSLTVELHSGV